MLDFDPTSQFVQGLAVVALILILFRDGLEVEEEALRREWHLPLRNLALAMPLTCVLVALATHTLTDLGWTESFLLGALLSPTDPVLSSVVVTHPRVPRIIRHSLNLESGPQRRPGPAGRARIHGRPRRVGRFRVVAVRAPGRAGGRGVRTR